MRPRLRFAILRRDGFRCIYCGKAGSSAMLHVDHIHPASAGGPDEAGNLVTACVECNSGKSNGPSVMIAFAHTEAIRLEENMKRLVSWRRDHGLEDQRHDRAFKYVAGAVSSPIDVGPERWSAEVSWWIFPPAKPAGMISPLDFDAETFDAAERHS